MLTNDFHKNVMKSQWKTIVIFILRNKPFFYTQSFYVFLLGSNKSTLLTKVFIIADRMNHYQLVTVGYRSDFRFLEE